MKPFAKSNAEFMDVVYKEEDGVKVCLDVYYPNTIKDKMPVLVYIHGGGFLWYDKKLIDENYRINHVNYKDELNKIGFVFVSVEYRKEKPLTNKTPQIEMIIADCKDALRWLGNNHIKLKLDISNIGLWGLSAGGALVHSIETNEDSLYKLVNDNMYNVKPSYIINFYGITDIVDFCQLNNIDSLQEDKLSEHVINMNNLLGEDILDTKGLENAISIARKNSPIYNLKKTNIPVVIYHGTLDEQVNYQNNAVAFCAKSRELGNDITLKAIAGKEHGFWWDTASFYNQLQKDTIEDIMKLSNNE